MGIVARVNGKSVFGGDMRELQMIHRRSIELHEMIQRRANRCCVILGIEPTTDSVARDIAEEIVLHGTPVAEAIAKLQKHLEQSNGQD